MRDIATQLHTMRHDTSASEASAKVISVTEYGGRTCEKSSIGVENLSAVNAAHAKNVDKR